ncbi:MAG: M14 family metallopeptidase [Flammeovirgaceae bacterium]
MSYFIPDSAIQLDSKIPSPADYLGFSVGEWHLSHDQLVGYCKLIDGISDRVTLKEQGKSYEARPLLLLTVTSPKNHQQIEKIRQEHLQLSNPQLSADLNTDKMPVVVWLGFSVHGNEPSGSNSVPLLLYYLAAAQGKQIEELLDNVVILIDPCLNPDGMNRFASWVNSHKSHTLVIDSRSREFNEPFPTGRSNHYWFDLNRDWLAGQLPESQARIQSFQLWKPNILTDHHEMGTNSTFFFQPGAPSRKNPLTPEKNVELTSKIGKFHAKALDRIGSQYYTQESFDDFYYGKGSTYPDIQGSIGILFEQASSRGHAQESEQGVVIFPFTIRNQLTTALSTLQAAFNMRKELLDYQRDFYKQSLEEANKNSVKAYIVGHQHDKTRVKLFAEMLLRHQIEVNYLKQDIEIQGTKFSKNSSLIIPLSQIQYKLIQGIFQIQVQFSDSLFYDISTWTMPYAFGLDFKSITHKDFNINILGKKVEQNHLYFQTSIEESNALVRGHLVGGISKIAYAFEWDSYYSPRALYRLQRAGVQTKVSHAPFSVMSGGRVVSFERGTILIPMGEKQNKYQREINQLIEEIINQDGIDVYSLESGLSVEGIDLGSPSFSVLQPPQVMLLVGEGINPHEAGEVWHLLDQRYQMPLSILETDAFNQSNFKRYSNIVLVSGNYSGLNANTVERLKNWVKEGGVLTLIGSASKWANQNGLASVKFNSNIQKDSLSFRPYEKLEADREAKLINGVIFEAEIDVTHPLAYGYRKNTVPIFKGNSDFIEKPKNAYSAPLHYTEKPLLSGYIHSETLKNTKNSVGIVVNTYGQGKVIIFADNPNFRAF